MYDEKEFDAYSNFDDRDIQHSKAAPKMGRSNKEEYGMEKNAEILNSIKSSNEILNSIKSSNKNKNKK